MGSDEGAVRRLGGAALIEMGWVGSALMPIPNAYPVDSITPLISGPVRRWIVLSLIGSWVILGRGSFAQDAAPPPTPATSREAALEDRLRKMEEMNQKLLEQFGNIASQNESLTKTVQDLSKRLDETTQAPKGAEARSVPNAANGGGGAASAGDASPEPLYGGLTSPPSAAERGVEGGKPKIPLKAFNDQNYLQRYGFVLQSEDKEFELRLNGLVQVDARIYQQQNQIPVISDIDIPRTRIWFSGRMTKPIEYQISFQRSTNSFDILNAYINFHYDDRLQFRAGRFQAPFTYEWAKLSIWELPAPERSPFAVNFGPNRQVGLMGWGNVLDEPPRIRRRDLRRPAQLVPGLQLRQGRDGVPRLPAVLRQGFEGRLPAEDPQRGRLGRRGQAEQPARRPPCCGARSPRRATRSRPASGDSIIAVPFLAFNSNVRERGQRALWELHATYFYKGLALLGGLGQRLQRLLADRPAAPSPSTCPSAAASSRLTYMVTGETREKITLVEPLHPFDLRAGKFGLGCLGAPGPVQQR